MYKDRWRILGGPSTPHWERSEGVGGLLEGSGEAVGMWMWLEPKRGPLLHERLVVSVMSGLPSVCSNSYPWKRVSEGVGE